MSRAWLRREGGDLLVTLKVQPRASRDELVIEPGRLRVRITAPPVDGAANAHLGRFLADCFGVAPSQVMLVHGAGSRDKLFRIVAPRSIPAALEAELTAE